MYRTIIEMEEALVRLLKATLDNTVKPDYDTTEDDDAKVINDIMAHSEVALSPWAVNELTNHIGNLQRPY